MARAATTSDAFNAIAEPHRRRILHVLASGERPVNDLIDQLRLTQPQVSKHLKVLREVGLVRCRTAGRQRVYRVHRPALEPINDWLRTFEQLWNDRYDRLDDLLVEIQAGSLTTHEQENP